MQNVWGGENVPENALSRKFLDPSKTASGPLCRGLFVQENRVLTPEGGGKRTVRGGVQNPFLGGVSFVRFSTPLLFPPPPWRPLRNRAISGVRDGRRNRKSRKSLRFRCAKEQCQVVVFIADDSVFFRKRAEYCLESTVSEKRTH